MIYCSKMHFSRVSSDVLAVEADIKGDNNYLEVLSEQTTRKESCGEVATLHKVLLYGTRDNLWPVQYKNYLKEKLKSA